jgi:hypothetical protein
VEHDRRQSLGLTLCHDSTDIERAMNGITGPRMIELEVEMG